MLYLHWWGNEASTLSPGLFAVHERGPSLMACQMKLVCAKRSRHAMISTRVYCGESSSMSQYQESCGKDMVRCRWCLWRCRRATTRSRCRWRPRHSCKRACRRRSSSCWRRQCCRTTFCGATPLSPSTALCRTFSSLPPSRYFSFLACCASSLSLNMLKHH